MAINSGIVLDFESDLPVSGAYILVYTTTGTQVIASGMSSPGGTFNINVPTTSSDLIYFPFKENSVGYSITCSPYQIEHVLHIRSGAYTPNISGTGGLNIYPKILRTSDKVTDVNSMGDNIYITTEAGLDVLDINTLENVGYVLHSGGFSCLTIFEGLSEESSILLGSSNSGVLEFVVPTTYSGGKLINNLAGKWSVTSGTLLSNFVTCMDVNISGNYIIGTNSGIDYYNSSTNSRYYHSYGSNIDTVCCYISKFDDLYYSPLGSGVYVKYGPVSSNWSSTDYTVLLSGTGSNPFPLLSNYINDIKITSISGGNSVFVASLSGSIRYNENRGDLDATASGACLIKKYP